MGKSLKRKHAPKAREEKTAVTISSVFNPIKTFALFHHNENYYMATLLTW